MSRDSTYRLGTGPNGAGTSLRHMSEGNQAPYAFDTLLVTVDDHVATVVLNRPEAHNAFTAGMTARPCGRRSGPTTTSE